MGLLDPLNIEHLIEKAMEYIDVVSITKDAMKDLIIAGEDMYFIVHESRFDATKLLGMAYSRESALKFAKNNEGSRVIRLDLGKLVSLAETMGAVEEIHEDHN